MRKLFHQAAEAALAAWLALTPIAAQAGSSNAPGMDPAAANAVLPTARLNLHVGNFYNPLDYDVQCDGSSGNIGHDCSTAINTGLALGNVLLPCGTFHVAHALNLGSYATTISNRLYGEGYCSILDVSTDFDPAANGVIVLEGNGNTPFPLPQQAIENLHIVFHQPTDIITTATAGVSSGGTVLSVASTAGIAIGDYIADVTTPAALTYWNSLTALNGLTTVTNIGVGTVTVSPAVLVAGVGNNDSLHFAHPRASFAALGSCTIGSGGTGCQYPWAVYAQGAGLPYLHHILVEGAWKGVYLHGGAVSVGGTNSYTIDDIQVGSLSVGFDVDDIHNFSRFGQLEVWNFGMGPPQGNQSAFVMNYYDGTNICANLGATDGINIVSLQCWSTIVNMGANWTWGTIDSLMLDGTSAKFTNSSTGGSNNTRITDMYVTSGANPYTTPIISITGQKANVQIGNLSGTMGGIATGINVTNGILKINSGQMISNIQGNAVLAIISQGELDVSNFALTASSSSGNLNTGFSQSSTGVLKLRNIDVSGTGNNGINLVRFGTDVAGNLANNIRSLQTSGTPFNVSSSTLTLASGPLGNYWPNYGYSQRSITSGSSDTELLFDQAIVWASASGSAKTQNIYGCGANNNNQTLTVIDGQGDASTHNITVTPQGGTISNASTLVMSTAHQVLNLRCNGAATNWVAG